MTAEMGKPCEPGMESARAASILRYAAGEAFRPAGEVYEPSVANQTLYTRRRPLGVVGLITPWNFPVAIPVWKLAPALVYGNTVVLKLGYEAPRTGLHIAECFAEAGLPAGVLNVLTGRGLEGGSRARFNRDVRALSFTGSVAGRPRGAQRGDGPQLPGAARARWPQPVHRHGRCRARPRRRGGVRGRLLVGRPEVHCDAEDPRAGHRLRHVPRPSSSPGSTPPRSATPPIPRRRSGRSSRPGRSRRSSRRSSAARRRAARSRPEAGVASDEGYLIAPTVFENVADDAFLSCEEVFGPGHLALPLLDARRGSRAGERCRVRPLRRDLHPRPPRDTAVRERAPGRHPPRQLADGRRRRARALRRGQGLGLGAARAGPRCDGVLHRDSHRLPGCAPWLRASSSRASSAASAPGSPRCVLDDGDASSATTSGTTAAARARPRGRCATGSRSSRATSPSSQPSSAPSTSTRSPASSTSPRCRCRSSRANPPLGMHVNVAGTVNVFDAVSRRLGRIPNVTYASSTAVYSASDPSPAPESGGRRPGTLYGVSKLADEGMARVYHAELGVPSIGLRPYVVYGPGRDQGMTSGPTAAMLAAVRGEPFQIGFSGPAQYDYAPDVARALVLAAHSGTTACGGLQRARSARRRWPRSSPASGGRAGRAGHLGRAAAAVPARARSGRLRPRRRPRSRGRTSPMASRRRWPTFDEPLERG